MSTYDDRLAALHRAAGFRAAYRSLRARLSAMRQARRARQLLSELDGHLLKDIGISRAEALTEAARPFWDLG